MEKKINYKKLTKEVARIAVRVGNYILKEQKKITAKDIEDKGGNSLVSYVDREAERKIISALKKLLPESDFLAEEEHTIAKKKKYIWVIDPLDGTTNFLHKLPVFSVSIALVENSEVKLGVVYEICAEECFSAYKNGGAFLNGKRISVSPVKKLSDSLLATGFPIERNKKMQGYLDILAYFMENSHGLRRLGSASVDLCYVACGRFEGFFEYNLNAWDVATGSIIVQEAGGKVTDFYSEKNFLFGKQIIGSNGKIHEEMREPIQRFLK